MIFLGQQDSRSLYQIKCEVLTLMKDQVNIDEQIKQLQAERARKDVRIADLFDRLRLRGEE